MRILLSLALAATTLACSAVPPDQPAAPAATATWVLDPDQSRLSFVSVKAGEIAEVHHFTGLSGTVAADGAATVSIPLAAVETNIDIRNERMRDLLFDVATHPTASFATRIDLAPMQQLAIGEQLRMPLAGELSLHGMTAPIETQVVVTRSANDRVLVTTLDPVVVNAGSFGLMAGLAELQKLANLPSITPDVPVTFQLVFAVQA